MKNLILLILAVSSFAGATLPLRKGGPVDRITYNFSDPKDGLKSRDGGGKEKGGSGDDQSVSPFFLYYESGLGKDVASFIASTESMPLENEVAQKIINEMLARGYTTNLNAMICPKSNLCPERFDLSAKQADLKATLIARTLNNVARAMGVPENQRLMLFREVYDSVLALTQGPL